MNKKIKHFLKQLIIPIGIIALTVGIQFFAAAYDGYWANTINLALKSITNILVIISIAWLAINLIAYGKRIVLEQHEIDSEDNLKARKIYTQISIFQRILNFVIVLIAIALILLNFDGIRKIGISLLASAGIAGLIIGFAAQKLDHVQYLGLREKLVYFAVKYRQSK